MSLFSRFKVLWVGFWSSVLYGRESKHHTVVAQGVLAAHKQHLRRIREALTNLIFQRKKLNYQLKEMKEEINLLKDDVKQAAQENRDELAVNLIAKLEKAEEEHAFIREQIKTLEADIASAREVEAQLVREINQSDQLLGTLSSRYEALRVRRNLQSQLLDINKSISQTPSKTKLPLYDQITRLESELDTMQTKRQDWEKQWDSMRSQRKMSRHHESLRKIKEKINRNVLPAVIVAEQAH